MSGSGSKFDLPEEFLRVLPADPFQQLDIARKITSIALSTRVQALESETSDLRLHLRDKDAVISALESQLQSLDASLNEASDQIAVSQQEKESLKLENKQLSSIVTKLNRDVAKLEAFRKTLMQSLQDDEDKPASALKVDNKYISSNPDDDSLSLPSRTTSTGSQLSDTGNSNDKNTENEAARPRVSQGLLLESQTSITPLLTPPGSPPRVSVSVSPSRTPNPASPRGHSASFSTARSFFDDKSSVSSSMSSSQFSSVSSLDSGSLPGKTRVDGKEFFRQVRTRLSQQQFAAFLGNVKELNYHRQTKEETLRKADEIFGSDNKDLYATFEALIMRGGH
ncbi:uncharacterized protein At4g15545-like [Henckelia pumila]|uniref:uncharacterized protein At4g15545-like n=1 Tax=Henckelia pumila TaxID=405737 RepID=UPI003C6E3496